MIFLFIHQNFPGQFRHVAKALSENHQHFVIGLGEAKNIQRSVALFPNIQCHGYDFKATSGDGTHHYVKEHEQHIRRGQTVVRSLISMKEKGVLPDVIVAHSGWGEALFIKQVFPDARIIHYCEYFYHNEGADVGFDPEFPSNFDNQFKMPIRNATQLLGLVQCDEGISPTAWQHSLYPKEFISKIHELHEGIDTNVLKPNDGVMFRIGSHRFTKNDQVITYVSRNLEPYRGFHQFMRALPKMQASCPDAHFIIVGGNEVSYGAKLGNGLTYKQKYLDELACLEKEGVTVDWSKVHFTGKLSYADYLTVLQVSSVHVYLTYPFVLSWSMLEAMSVGCVVVGSNTQPVEEVIDSGQNGLLVDFFDQQALVEQVNDVIYHPEKYFHIGVNARESMKRKYDLNSITLPQWLRFIEKRKGQHTNRPLNEWYQEGFNFLKEANYKNALQVYQALLACYPECVKALIDQGNVYARFGEFNRAEVSFKQALKNEPQNTRALQGYANLLRWMGRLDESVKLFHQTCKLTARASVQWDYAFTLLSLGRYKEAWPYFNARHDALGLRKIVPTKDIRWNGDLNATGRLLVLDEQGIGDTLQFSRFVFALVSKSNMTVSFAGKPSVLSLMKRILPASQVVNWDDVIPEFDSWVPLMTLPELFSIERPEQIMPPVGSELLDVERTERWRSVLSANTGSNDSLDKPVVALCWRGNPNFSRDDLRSPGLEVMRPLFELDNVEFISLQLGGGEKDIIDLSLDHKIKDIGKVIEQEGSDVLDTLAVLQHCDFVISSCTSLIHMAGMLGRPSMVLLSKQADWRWMHERRDSPWYPSVTLLRQTVRKEWGDVIVEAKSLLSLWHQNTNSNSTL